MTDPRTWLAARLAEAPPALRERMERGVYGSPLPAPDFAAELRRRAESLLAEASAGAPDHATALTLLAADALMTLACEWAAETEPGALGEMA